MLKPGQVIKTPSGDLWYVDYVSVSGAHCIHLSAHPTPITTRKGITKVVKRHLKNAVFSASTIADLVDPTKLDSLQLKRRLAMARKEGTVAETVTTETKHPAQIARESHRYVRTTKAPLKEMRGQAKETFEALVAAGSEPLTVKQLSERCTYAGSRQDKERVAGFYLAQFKKDGLVDVVPAAATAAA